MENVIKSQRNRDKFHKDGYIYVFDRLSTCETVQFWRCERRKECKARVHVANGEIIKTVNVHNHDSTAAKVQADRVVNRIIKRAQETQEPTSQVINHCLENIGLACQGALPSQGAMKKTVRRKRNQINHAPPNPATLNELEIPEHYRSYDVTPDTTENFLLADSGPAPDRILIFGRQRNLQMVANCADFFMDGTFKIAPNLFQQVFVILVKRYGGIHIAFFALLPRKSRDIYDKLFDMLQQLVPTLNPQSVSCDFELAALQSFRAHFPQAEVRGCFFHLAQNMKKHLGQLHLIHRYQNDADFAMYAKMVIALAFVPIPDLDHAILTLSDNLPNELEQLLDWFEDNYIGRRNRRGAGRREPMFSPNIWNVYNRTLNGEDRTNNHAEAAHRRLQTELGMDNPTIWRFIDGLRAVQRYQDKYYEELVAGRAAPVKLKKYRDADQRLLTIVRDYGNRDLLEYMRGIAHNYQVDF